MSMASHQMVIDTLILEDTHDALNHSHIYTINTVLHYKHWRLYTSIPLLICNHNYDPRLVLPLLESQECICNLVKSPENLFSIFQRPAGKVGNNKVLELVLPLGPEQ